MFNRKLKERIVALEVVLDALIGLLVTRKVVSREDIQRYILTHAKQEPEDER